MQFEDGVAASVDSIELRVPRAFVAEATFPFTIATGSSDAAHPDFAYSTIQ